MELEEYNRGISYATAIKQVIEQENYWCELESRDAMRNVIRNDISDLYGVLIDTECHLVDDLVGIVVGSYDRTGDDTWESFRIVAEAYLANNNSINKDCDWMQTCYDYLKQLATQLGRRQMLSY